MKTSTIIWVVVILIIIIGGVWWYMSSGMVPATAPTTQTQTTGAATNITTAAPSVMLATNASLGSLLTGTNGMTLYTYAEDTPETSNCTGQCAVAWPPYTVAAGTTLALPAGATGTLGTLTRADGTTQVTYNGMPLYFFAQDTNPGDATGQNVNSFVVAKP